MKRFVIILVLFMAVLPAMTFPFFESALYLSDYQWQQQQAAAGSIVAMSTSFVSENAQAFLSENGLTQIPE